MTEYAGAVDDSLTARQRELEGRLVQLSLQLKAKAREVGLWRQLGSLQAEHEVLTQKVRAEQAEHCALCSQFAVQHPIATQPVIEVLGNRLQKVEFRQLNYPPTGWVCDVCRRSMARTSPLYHGGPIGTPTDNGFDCCMACAARLSEANIA